MLKVPWVACLMLIVFSVGPAVGQTGLTGEVVNWENGAAIVGARIIVISGTKKFETLSNGVGGYELKLDPGKYNVLIEALGFKKVKRKNVKIVGKGLFTFNVNMHYSAAIIVDGAHP